MVWKCAYAWASRWATCRGLAKPFLGPRSRGGLSRCFNRFVSDYSTTGAWYDISLIRPNCHRIFSKTETNEVRCGSYNCESWLSPYIHIIAHRKFRMENYPDYGASYTAHAQRPVSHRSFAPSTHNWVHSQQQQHHPAVAPPPRPVEYPTPVRTLRPLPNPYEPKTRPLRVVNNADPDPRSFNALHDGDANTSDVDAPAPKKKRAIDKWMKGIRRIPQNLFRSKAGSAKSTTYATATEGLSSPSATDFTANSLPGYTSKPTSPLAPHVRPAMQQMQQFQDEYQPQVAPKSQLATTSSYPGRSTPMPDVVRLSTTSSTNARRHNPSFRVTPPSDDFLYEQSHNAPLSNNPATEAEREDASIYGTPRAERATVMVYSNSLDNRRSQSFSQHQQWANHPTPQPTPPSAGPSRQLSASPGLSYVSEEEPPAVLVPGRIESRHSSFHAPPPPPIEIPQGYTGSVRRVSYASQAPPRRDTPPDLVPGAFPSSEASAFHSAAHSTHMDITHGGSASLPYAPPDPAPSGPELPNSVVAPADAMSPVSIHPAPTADYRKMTLSPSPSSHLSLSSGGRTSATDHATSTSGYYDPSFASQLNMNRFERFFKTLYHMPWISHARVTADYAPGEGIGRKPAKKLKAMNSWYRGLGQGRARAGDRRGSGGSLDLLSDGTASMSLGAGAALLMDDGAATAAAVGNALRVSSADGEARRRESATTARRKSDRDYERRSRAQGRRKAATWLDGKYDKNPRSRSHRDRDHDYERDHHREHVYSGDHHSEYHKKDNAPSPLIPPIYPFAFPTYPYAGYPAYQTPLSNLDSQASQAEADVKDGMNPPAERPRGPRPLVQQQPFVYAVPTQAMYGLNTYPTQMVAASPQQVYFLPPAALTSPALQQTVGGGGDGAALEDARSAPPQAQPLRHQISSPTLMYLQPIPGAF